MRVDCDVNGNGFIACGAVQINTYFMWLGTRIMRLVQNVNFIISLLSLVCLITVFKFRYIVEFLIQCLSSSETQTKQQCIFSPLELFASGK